MSQLPAKLYTAEQVRCLDFCAINDHDIAGYDLMQRAGRAVLKYGLEHFPDALRWTVLCGAGNNAGDGYVVARMAAKAGKQVRLFALKPHDQLKDDANTAAQDWLRSGGEVLDWPPVAASGACDLLIDALLGTGLDRPVKGVYREAIEWMNTRASATVSVDIPSGLGADTGQIMDVAVKADATISFIGLKRGLFTCDGPDRAGKIIFDALQLPESVYMSVPDNGHLIRENMIDEILLPRNRNAHKGNFGHVLLAGGYPGMGGAVRLAGEAALRTGSGLVSVATHPSHADVLNLGRPELMVRGIGENTDIQPLIGRASAIAVGPGLATHEWSSQLLLACLEAECPVVIDADGLNLLADMSTEKQEAIKDRGRRNWMLTPHPGEAARLLQITTSRVQADRVKHALDLARRYQATIVLKGCGSVVADHQGRYAICPLGNPGMATAGSGDVLTGVIASLAGQGLSPWQAVQIGVVIHAAAGDLAASRFGERGMLAGDIIDSIPQIIG